MVIFLYKFIFGLNILYIRQ